MSDVIEQLVAAVRKVRERADASRLTEDEVLRIEAADRELNHVILKNDPGARRR